MKEFILYSYFRSSASYRVRIALNLKRIDYEYRAVHLLNNGGEQNLPEYRKLNPSCQVPTLIHNLKSANSSGPLVLGQSMAIISYLDSITEESALFPKNDPALYAQVLQACEIVNSGTQPLANTPVLAQLESQFHADNAQKSAWIANFFHRGLQALEDYLAPRSGQYSFGNTISAADCFVIPQLASADRFQVRCDKYPTLAKIRQNCIHLDAFKRATPDVQPDTPAAP